MDEPRVPFWKSYTALLFVAYGFTTVLLIALFTVLVFENQTDLIAENALYTALSTGDQIQESAESLVSDAGGSVKVESLLARLEEIGADTEDIQIESLNLYDDLGNEVGSERTGDTDLENLRDIQTAITKRDFQSRLFHHRVNVLSREIVLFIPVAIDSDLLVVRAILSIPRIDERLSYLRRQVFILLGVSLLLHGAFIVYAHHTALRPFKSLSVSVDRIARGEFDKPIPRFHSFEFSKLSEDIERMSYAVRDMQDTARSANPLTSLPGNVEIERHIRERIAKGEHFCVLYGDLDNFKAYNDVYGFNKGDSVILFTRDVLTASVKKLGIQNTFIGHEGGDDFVMTCDYDDWEKLASTCTERFDSGIGKYYSPEDRKKGFVDSVDRRGVKRRFPIVGISIAVVSNNHRKISSIGEVAKIAAEMKKFVKGIRGSAYAIDRRID